MASRSAIESWPGFEASNGLRILNKDLLYTISAESFFSRRVKKGSAAWQGAKNLAKCANKY